MFNNNDMNYSAGTLKSLVIIIVSTFLSMNLNAQTAEQREQREIQRIFKMRVDKELTEFRYKTTNSSEARNSSEIYKRILIKKLRQQQAKNQYANLKNSVAASVPSRFTSAENIDTKQVEQIIVNQAEKVASKEEEKVSVKQREKVTVKEEKISNIIGAQKVVVDKVTILRASDKIQDSYDMAKLLAGVKIKNKILLENITSVKKPNKVTYDISKLLSQVKLKNEKLLFSLNNLSKTSTASKVGLQKNTKVGTYDLVKLMKQVKVKNKKFFAAMNKKEKTAVKKIILAQNKKNLKTQQVAKVKQAAKIEKFSKTQLAQAQQVAKIESVAKTKQIVKMQPIASDTFKKISNYVETQLAGREIINKMVNIAYNGENLSDVVSIKDLDIKTHKSELVPQVNNSIFQTLSEKDPQPISQVIDSKNLIEATNIASVDKNATLPEPDHIDIPTVNIMQSGSGSIKITGVNPSNVQKSDLMINVEPKSENPQKSKSKATKSSEHNTEEVIQDDPLVIKKQITVPQTNSVINEYKTAVNMHRLGFYEKAVEQLKKIIEVYPKYTKAYQLLYEISMAQNDIKTAEHYLESALSTNNRDITLSLLLAKIKIRQNKNDQALTLLEAYTPDIKEQPEFYATAALAHSNIGKFMKAADIYSSLIRLDGENGNYWFGLAFNIDKAGNYNTAREIYMKGLTKMSMRPELSHYARMRISGAND